MNRNLFTRLGWVLIILALALWIDFNDTLTIPNPFSDAEVPLAERSVKPKLGLDLQGGMQVLLEADLPAGTPVDAEAMQVARTIIENRTNAYGVSENVITVAGTNRIVGEFPGVEDSENVIATLQKTGLLEFVDPGTDSFSIGQIVVTDFQTGLAPGDIDPVTGTKVYATVMTGKDLKTVSVGTDQIGKINIPFILSPEGAEIFATHTRNNIQKQLAIVLDKEVISAPTIQSEIPSGEGVIEGTFTEEEASNLVVQLRYGSLPIPLKIVESRLIGPSLGADSLQKSLIAGLIGMIIVILFMGVYYRLPGITAAIAILFYGVLAFAIFKFFHFTLTLPGIAGFLLSTGSALDANILVFERIKEELRSGRTLSQAVSNGWLRARSSIMDSNIATLITSGILYWFGSTFGATIVKGFSLTLALGVAISLFTAFYVTRPLLDAAVSTFKPKNLPRWFGI